MTGWRKSSFSGGNTDCVEVSLNAHQVGVRDSKKPEAALVFPTAEWRTFLRR